MVSGEYSGWMVAEVIVIEQLAYYFMQLLQDLCTVQVKRPIVGSIIPFSNTIILRY